MTPSKLGLLAAVGAIALFIVPACEPETGDLRDFAGSGGGPVGGTAGTAGGGNTSQSDAGAGGEPTSGGSAGEAPGGGNTSGGESSTGGQTGNGGSDLGGSPSGGQGGSGGESSGQGGSGTPGEGWYCVVSSNSCVCVQEPLEVGDCGIFNCCYTYDGGVSGLACSCNNATGPACDNNVANNDGTRVDYCPP